MHCTLGDISIATVALMVGLIAVGSAAWPTQRFGHVLVATAAAAASYTVYSEYMNTVVGQNWSYTPTMPTLPWLGTGLTPFAQWLAVPTLSLVWSYRAASNQRDGERLCRE